MQQPLRSVVGALSASLILAIAAAADDAAPPQRPQACAPATAGIVFLDVTGDSDAANRALAFTCRNIENHPTLVSALDKLSSATTPGAVEAARNAVEAEAKLSTQRILSDKGNRLEVFIVFKGVLAPDLSVTEVARKTRLREDLGVLLKLVQAIGGAAVDDMRVERKTYTLQQKHGTVTLASVRQGSPGTIVSQASTALTTGPAEHFYLSANVPVSQLKELSYSQDTGQLELKDKPTHWLAGFDYAFRDVAVSDPSGPSVKLLVEGSAHPADTLGLALGWRGGIGPLNLEPISLFAGAVRYYEDAKPKTGESSPRRERRIEAIVGLSLHLDAALDWLKK